MSLIHTRDGAPRPPTQLGSSVSLVLKQEFSLEGSYLENIDSISAASTAAASRGTTLGS